MGISKAVPWLAWFAQVQRVTGTSKRDYAELLWLPAQLSRNLCTTGYTCTKMIRWWECPSLCRCWWASLQVASLQASTYKWITCFYQRHSKMRLSVPYVNTKVSQCSLEALWKQYYVFYSHFLSFHLHFCNVILVYAVITTRQQCLCLTFNNAIMAVILAGDFWLLNTVILFQCSAAQGLLTPGTVCM